MKREPINRRGARAATGRVASGRLILGVFAVAAVAAITVALVVVALDRAATPSPDRQVAESLGRGHAALTALRRDRIARLHLAARVLAAEPALLTVIGSRDPAIRGAALADLLSQRRGDLGFDFALVLDPAGRVLAAQGQAVAALAAADLATDPLVVAAGTDGVAQGAWLTGGPGEAVLTDAAIVRVAPAFEPLGFVVAGAVVDDVLTYEVARASGAGVTFTAGEGDGAGDRGAVASSLPEAVAAGLAASPPRGAEPRPVVVAGRRLVVLAVPLAGPAGPAGPAAGHALLSVQVAGGPPILLLGTAAALAAALLLALVLAVFAARRILAPVARLAETVAVAPHEGFARRLDAGRAGPLAPLAVALDRLFGRLQEERSLALVAAAGDSAAPEPFAETAPDGGVGAAGDASAGGGSPSLGGEPQVARADQVVLLVVDLRGYARRSGGGAEDAGVIASRLQGDLAQIGAEVSGRGGQVIAGAGHRLLALFAAGAELAALAAGAAVLGAAADEPVETDPQAGETVALAIAAGAAVWRPGVAASGSGAAGFVVGPAVQLAESLLREAAAGDLVLAPQVARAVTGELAEIGVETRELRGILSPRPLHRLERVGASLLAAAVPKSAPSAAGPVADPGEVAAAATAREPGPLAAPPGFAGLPPAPPGAVIEGRYLVSSRIAVHADGDLARVWDRRAGRAAALRRVAATAGLPGAAAAAALEGPLQTIRRLSHPGVARLLDTIVSASGAALLREWIVGRPVGRLESLPLPAALALARQLGATLAAVHAEGLAHGRLVPENLILEPSGRLRLTDLGLSHLARTHPSATAGEACRAPELAAELADGGRAAAPRADVYAAGALLHCWFRGGWPDAAADGEVPSDPAPGVELPPALAGLVARCLAESPEDRFADGGELVAALEEIRV